MLLYNPSDMCIGTIENHTVHNDITKCITVNRTSHNNSLTKRIQHLPTVDPPSIGLPTSHPFTIHQNRITEYSIKRSSHNSRTVPE
ncbi:hypothetical protein CEXT_98611 [Caerostris extrusa]|uniref:Uncharacterized protein n=1 Tax=Caerostris extrusa TaxID=172846 RepID=A0AAV4XJK6_CAEEX|nr:hypothetical protein CEXT_98611 [Caerostris extrusa]